MNAFATTAVPVAIRLIVSGPVQGIGMRPAIIRLAESLNLMGYVSNTNAGLQIHVEGTTESIDRFAQELPRRLPMNALILSSCAGDPRGFATFSVHQDVSSMIGEPMSAHVPLDQVQCNSCRDEVNNPNDRRYHYPFTSCTDCGPRYSMIKQMPYEREQTSMDRFPLCVDCRQEFDSSDDRRFHAQSTACHLCGPKWWVRNAHGNIIADGNDAIRFAAQEIREGRIVALRGIGGYQLLVDATSQIAVQRLRQRKHRSSKPFAVMVSCLYDAEKLAKLNDADRRALTSSAGPIVVAPTSDEFALALSVNENVSTIGLFLPTTPLHQLLSNEVRRPLVCTSGNVEGEPLAYESCEAVEALGGVADYWLEHDRDILRPIDDSVVRVVSGRVVSLRLARGLAPMVLDTPASEPIIAVGGHQKVALALSNGSQAILGPHIGDMDTIAARSRFVQQVEQLTALYGVQDQTLVGDLHPDYFTSSWMKSQPHPFIQVQHHHAHIVAGMLQHGWLDRQVLGVAFDGTGYGCDGTIWGGEFLLCTATDFKRVGHLRPFLLPGGDRTAREPWRIATTLVRDALGAPQAAQLSFGTGDAAALLSLLNRPKLSPTTTSAGRLFDGAAALILGIERCDYEGQAAILLEDACDESAEGCYALPRAPEPRRLLDWRPMIQQIMQDLARGESQGAMAMKFHRSIANAITQVCHDCVSMPIVLGGGVFQNRVLVELLARQLRRHTLGLPGKIPPNDGGLAAGQLAIAAAQIRQGRTR